MEYYKMTLTKAELNALMKIYSGKNSLSELSTDLNVVLSQISSVVANLEKKHLCRKIKVGKRIKVEIADTSLGIAFKKLIVQSMPLKLDEFLYGLRFKILSSCLYESKTTKEIATMLNVSRKSIQNIIYSLLNRTVLRRDKGEIIFQKEAWPLLYNFLDAYRNFSLKGDVLWKFGDKIVFEEREMNELNGTLTGFSVYEQYGVPVINVKYCYYFPKVKLTKKEIFMHSLMQIGNDTRLLELAIVFFKKNKLKEKDIICFAPIYDLKKKVNDFVSLLESNDFKIITNNLPPVSKKEINEIIKLYK